MRSRKRSLSQLVLLYVFLQFLDLYSGKDADVDDGIINANQRNDERQHLVRGEAERPPSDNVSFINPIGGGSSEPAKPCDITVSKNKTDFNKLSAPV